MDVIEVNSPFGVLNIEASSDAVTALKWGATNVACERPSDLLREAKRQVEAYFESELTRFDLPCDVQGSSFQRDVCHMMADIPYGETRTYGQIAKALGAPAQAVGQACGGNPIPIIIPCHRVLGASGLGGFSAIGGVETKVALLRHEGAASLLI